MFLSAWQSLAGCLTGLFGLMLGLRWLSRGLGGAVEGAWGRRLRGAAAHPWTGVGLGALATALLQSSSATIIAILGLTEAGVVSFRGAAFLVMGANIGTTVTAQLLAFRPGPVALVLLVVGAASQWLAPGRADGRWRRAGLALAGFGLIFLGLELLQRSLAPLGRTELFRAAVTVGAEYPWIGVLAGSLLTALLFSSSLSIALLQSLLGEGAISLAAALPVLYGDNIGTTADTLLASLAGGERSRRVALFHLLFNLVGTLLFLLLTPWVLAVVGGLGGSPARQLANAHTLFNGVNTLVQIPILLWIFRWKPGWSR